VAERFVDLPSRTWSMVALGVMGAVCGDRGGVITGATGPVLGSLVALSSTW
jgi:hypothetical protein